jgi:hypothetical protein
VIGLPERLLISGVPGAGKSWFVAWLRAQGFRALKIDDPLPTHKENVRALMRGDIAAGRAILKRLAGSPSLHDIRNAARNGDRARVTSIVDRVGRHVVIEFGFEAGPLATIEIRTFVEAGFAAWWFDAAHDDALRAYSKTKLADGFHGQWDAIAAHRAEIAARYPQRIITTLHGETHMRPEEIAAEIAGARARN